MSLLRNIPNKNKAAVSLRLQLLCFCSEIHTYWAGKFHALGKREMKGYPPFLRERKSPKKSASVRIALPPDNSEYDTVGKAATDAHSSGGIVALFTKIPLCEYRFAVVCAFENGKDGKRRLASSFINCQVGYSSWNE